MEFWDKIKIDIQKGLKEGIGMVREGVTVVREKAEELTEEGKKRLKLFELKTKVQREVSELGGRVYAIGSKVKNPMVDKKVNAIVARIKKIEAQIAKLEGLQKEKSMKTTPKRRVRVKSKA